MARREQEMKQLASWKATVSQIITQLEETLRLAAPLTQVRCARCVLCALAPRRAACSLLVLCWFAALLLLPPVGQRLPARHTAAAEVTLLRSFLLAVRCALCGAFPWHPWVSLSD